MKSLASLLASAESIDLETKKAQWRDGSGELLLGIAKPSILRYL